MAVARAPTARQIRDEYLTKTARRTLRYGQIFAAISIPFLAWYIYQDHALGFGAETLGWRVFALSVSGAYLFASLFFLPGHPFLTLAAHLILLAAPIINAAGLTVTLFVLRPDAVGFEQGVRGALFVTIFAAFAFADGARRHLWAVVSLPIAGMAIALLAVDTLAPEEWALFSDVVIACFVVSIVAFRQERIHFEEFQMRSWANHRKEALELRLNELRQLNRQLREFAYLVSHDLKEPLHTVGGFLGLAGESLSMANPDLDKISELLGRAQDGTERMTGLMDGLLTYSRLDTTPDSHRRVSLDATLDEVLANLEGSIRESGARIERQPLPEVLGDPNQLVQLFQNLLSNAIKYHRPGAPPEIKVHTEPGDERVTVVVADYGIGIDAKHHDRVFRLFQRLHTREEYEGTGVGLAVVRRIVERHGGEISLDSDVDAGATFRVSLPKS